MKGTYKYAAIKFLLAKKTDDGFLFIDGVYAKMQQIHIEVPHHSPGEYYVIF